jgi:hypothetical protein
VSANAVPSEALQLRSAADAAPLDSPGKRATIHGRRGPQLNAKMLGRRAAMKRQDLL